MKKFILMLTLIIMFTSTSTLAADIPGYEGGIQNENTYKEVVFITGEPIVMEGTLDIKVKERDNTITETYRYKLSNPLEDAQLDRTIKITATLTPNGNQVVSTRTLDSFKEKIDIGDNRYQSKDEDYQWNQSTITHLRPILEYFAGDTLSRKTYTINREDTNTVTVEARGALIGYNSPWSSTDTQTIEYIIEREDRFNPENNWKGTATVETSYNRTKDYSYEENIPVQTSFRGGQNIVERHENVLKYSYDLPRIRDNIILKGRNMGKDSFSINTVPVPERLSIPASRDIIGHIWEEELFLLASMDALPLNSTYIGPNTPMSRGDFARAVVESMDIPLEKEEEQTSRRRRKQEEPDPPMFKDVGRDHRNFHYVETAAKKGIIDGKSNGYFYSDQPMTKAEAYTTLMRLLGLENLAPTNKNYTTGYKDDSQIPNWAKDYIYVAKDRGIAERGDYFYPNMPITKGEAAKLIVDLINYMQEDLRQDYRENLLNS